MSKEGSLKVAIFSRKYAVVAVCVAALAVGACSGSSNRTADNTPEPTPEPTPPTPKTVALPEGHGLKVGETTIPAGQTIRTGSVDLTCTGDTACTLIVTQDGVTGLFSATSTGGTVMAMLPPAPPAPPAPPTPTTVALPTGHGLNEDNVGTTSIPAGDTVRVGGVDLTCTGDTACTLIVTQDTVTKLISVGSTGGTVTAMLPPAPPTPTTVALPTGHGLNEDNVGTTSIPAGETRRVGAVDIACTGDTACMLTVTQDEVTGLFSAASTGGTVTAMLPPPPPLGFSVVNDLRTYLRTLFGENGVPVAGASPSDPTPAANYAASFHVGTEADGTDNGKLVVAHTTHGADTINDFDVTVAPTTVTVPAGSIYTGGAGGTPADRSASFSVAATWKDDQNEAQGWTAQRTGIDGNSAWNHLALTRDLDGGRTLHVDLYTDYDHEATRPVTDATLAATDLGTADLTVVLGTTTVDSVEIRHWQFGEAGTSGSPFDASDEVTIPQNVIVFANDLFKSPGDLETGERMDIPEPTADSPATVAGTWRGIPGIFTCADAEGGNGNCFIRNQAGAVTSGGIIRFTPNQDANVIRAHTSWLSAGTWLTVPDNAEGETAGGAFVHGADPFTVANIAALMGDATYTGSAFGRYAEREGEDRDAGRFTATATLTAAFGDASAPGTVSGALSAFSGGNDDWSVNLDSAAIGTDGRFDDEVTGHAGGVALDGLWAGEFFGNGAATTDQPRSVGGTFNASDRGAIANYSLTLIGAFTARRPDPTPSP